MCCIDLVNRVFSLHLNQLVIIFINDPTSLDIGSIRGKASAGPNPNRSLLTTDPSLAPQKGKGSRISSWWPGLKACDSNYV